MGAKAADMLRLLPQAQGITVIERCSGHGGSWGVKKDNFETALKIGKPATRKAAEVLETAAEKNQPGFVASECPLAAIHIVQGISGLAGNEDMQAIRPYHPIEIFALSYGLVRDTK
jgi:glycerol-3-phosphate dehydrogenase subunit C